MTLILLLLALFASTQPVTIHTTPSTQKEHTMAQGNPGAPGGGANNQNRGRAARAAVSYPTRHPNTPGPGHGPGTTYNRIGRIASNPTEHTTRPKPL